MITTNKLSLADKEELRKELNRRTTLLSPEEIDMLLDDFEKEDSIGCYNEKGILNDAEITKLMGLARI